MRQAYPLATWTPVLIVQYKVGSWAGKAGIVYAAILMSFHHLRMRLVRKQQIYSSYHAIHS